ncbi:MAG: hypothetical protein WCV55_00905 [Candidatus Paceibacterota bacterium]
METTTLKQNSRGNISRETAIVANGKEAIVGVPVIVPPIEVEVTLRIILVQIRDVAVAIDLVSGALYEKPPISLLPNFFKSCIEFVTLIYHLVSHTNYLSFFKFTPQLS